MSPGPGLEDLRGMVGRLLEVDPAELDEDVDLIRYGMNSLLLIQAVEEVRLAGVEVDYEQMLENRTLGAWERLIANAAEPVSREASGEPVADASGFRLTEIQHGYWYGAAADVTPHFHLEFDGVGIDPARLKAAVADLIRCQPALRVRLTPDGRGTIHPAPLGRNPVTVHEITAGRPAARFFADLRSRGVHAVREDQGVPLFRIDLACLPSGRCRLGITVDMVICDYAGLSTMLRQLAEAYAGRPTPVVDEREYLRVAAPETDPDPADALVSAMSAVLPGPPRFRGGTGCVLGGAPRSVTYSHHIDVHRWSGMAQAAEASGVEVRDWCSQAFVDAVGRFAEQDDFSILLAETGGRPGMSGDDAGDGVVADRSGIVVVPAEAGEEDGFMDRAQALGERRSRITAAGLSAAAVVRGMRGFEGGSRIMHVIHSMALGAVPPGSGSVAGALGQPIWFSSQAPGVVIDSQVLPAAPEDGGGVVLSWDIREDRLPPGLGARVFGEYLAQLDARAVALRDVAPEYAAETTGSHGEGKGTERRWQADPVAEVIALAMEEMLHGPIGVDGDFLVSGGDSMMATRLAARLREAFETPSLDIAAVIVEPVPGKLAARIRELNPAAEGLARKLLASQQGKGQTDDR